MTGAGPDSVPLDSHDDAVRTPVTRKLFRAALLLYLGAAALVTAAFIAEAWYTARTDLARELSVYQRTLEEALAAPLWSVDIEAITAIGMGMLEIPEIAASTSSTTAAATTSPRWASRRSPAGSARRSWSSFRSTTGTPSARTWSDG